ncbi:hypothetical protein MX850_10115 [Erysipelothrix sp. Poltava]|nr:hypothetical protein MX850_10115 [Erysipelothrix sp. Poltava]
MKIEENPELYRGDILNKLATTYEKYHDHLIVFYLDSHSSNTLGNLIFLNETALKLNNINTESVKRYQHTDTIPIITSDSRYTVGDQIQSEGLNYVIAEVVEKPFTFLGPSDYTELSSKDYQIAYFDITNINQQLQLTNSNFIDELFFMNLSEDEVERIRDDLNEPTFKYQVSSIKSIQQGFYHQKMLMLASYLGVGMINMIFRLIWLDLRGVCRYSSSLSRFCFISSCGILETISYPFISKIDILPYLYIDVNWNCNDTHYPRFNLDCAWHWYFNLNRTCCAIKSIYHKTH